jgi:NAD(P)-dependent dehydrogenase (short-subunit alcohol dehydrogenase family)
MIDSVLGEAAERLGTIEILVNNAGVVADVRSPDYQEFATVAEVVPGTWDYVMALDLSGPWYLIRGVLPGMCELGRGSIVNVSSVTSYVPSPGEGAYSAAKGGLLSLTRAVAYDMGSRGIRCNAVAPAHVNTNFIRRNAERFQYAMDSTPLGRFGEPEEVASVIAFLASDDASWITGEAIVVSGGWYMAP